MGATESLALKLVVTPLLVAAQASVGILAGTLSQAAFALAYAWCTRKWSWAVCLGAATVAFAAVTVVPVYVKASALLALAFGAAIAGALAIQALSLFAGRRLAL